MTSAISELWAAPPDHAPDIQREAHRWLMTLLQAIESRVPNVLSTPQENRGDRILDAALAAALETKADPAIRAAGLDLLQRRVRTFDPTLRQRLFLAPPPAQLPLTAKFGRDIEQLMAFRQALERYLVQERPRPLDHPTPGNGTPAESADLEAAALLALGCLLALLVLRQGQCYPNLLTQVVESLDKPITIAGRWAWVDLALPETVRSTSQLRRLLMDPSTAVAWVRAALGKSHLPAFDAKEASERRAFYRRLAGRSLKHLQAKLQPHFDGSVEPAPFSVKELCAAQANLLRVESLPLIASYATGLVNSTSLTEDTWVRLLGYRLPVETEVATAPPTIEDGAITGISSIPRKSSGSYWAEQWESGEHGEDGLLAELRELMHRPRAQWGDELNTVSERLAARDGKASPPYLAVRWLHHLAVERRNKGKRLSDGTLRHYRSLLVARLVVALPPLLTNLDEDVLTDRYQSLVSSDTSRQQAGRIMAAARDFDRFVRTHCLPDLPKARLPGFSGGAYAISSRIITDNEYQQVQQLTQNQSIAFTDERQASQVRVFLALGFRLGLRRSEIFGLQVRDFRWGEKPVLLLRPNALRGLKSDNGVRIVPLSSFWKSELQEIKSLCDFAKPDAFLFFQVARPDPRQLESHPVIGRVNDILERVTGDAHLHPHNLRHSFPTLALLGMLGPDVGIDTHPYAEPWMRTAQISAKRIDEAISGTLHRMAARGSALSMAMGHGHETTTYQHYVHCLDLLLFFASNRHLHAESPQHRDRFLKGEVALLTALFGYHPTTRIETNDPAKLLQRLAKLAPDRCRICISLQDASTLVSEEPLAGVRAALKLETLLALPGSAHQIGYPKKQAELDTANATLKLLNDWYRAKPEDALEFLGLWTGNPIIENRWSSLSAADTRRALEIAERLSPSTAVIRVMHVWQPAKTRRSQKRRLQTPEELKNALRLGKGRFWIRIQDPRTKGKSGERERTQSTVTWVLNCASTVLDHVS